MQGTQMHKFDFKTIPVSKPQAPPKATQNNSATGTFKDKIQDAIGEENSLAKDKVQDHDKAQDKDNVQDNGLNETTKLPEELLDEETLRIQLEQGQMAMRDSLVVLSSDIGTSNVTQIQAQEVKLVNTTSQTPIAATNLTAVPKEEQKNLSSLTQKTTVFPEENAVKTALPQANLQPTEQNKATVQQDAKGVTQLGQTDLTSQQGKVSATPQQVQTAQTVQAETSGSSKTAQNGKPDQTAVKADKGENTSVKVESATSANAAKTVSQTEQKPSTESNVKGEQQNQTKAKSQAEEVKTNEMNTLQKAEKLDAGKVNIKVAEPYTANTESKQFVKQFADKIVFSGADGSREIEIQLMPKDLGKVTIKIIFEGNSALVQMTATNAKAQNILNLNAESIKQIVETNTNTNVVVSVNDESKLNQQREAFDGRGEKQAKEQEPEKDRDALDEDSQIAFVNQLRLGLLNKDAS